MAPSLRSKSAALEKEKEQQEERMMSEQALEMAWQNFVDEEEGGYDDGVDEAGVTELLALNGWGSRLEQRYHMRHVTRRSRIPSPFADPVFDIDERFLNFMTEPVQRLWLEFRNKKQPSERQMPSDGSKSFCGVLEDDDNDFLGKYYTMEPAEEALYFSVDNGTKGFYMRRLMRAGDIQTARDEGFFIVNEDFDHFRVNGRAMNRYAVAGPLPDFAVIELDSIAVFWWRNLEALTYVPKVEHKHKSRRPKHGVKRGRGADDRRKAKKQKNNSSHEAGNKPSGSGQEAIPISSEPSKTWQDLLDEGMQRHRQCKAKKEAGEKARPTGPFRVLKEPDTLSEDEGILAIATFWEALRHDDQLFAFAGLDFFGQVNSSDQDSHLTRHGVVGAPKKLIMPLLLHPLHKKGADPVMETRFIGHLVLVTAEWRIKENKIALELFDSRQNTVTKESIKKRAKDLIIGSRWPYEQKEGSAPAFFTETKTKKSPRQEGTNTCGFYMIFNAWCVLLGIPIHPKEERRVHSDASDAFLRDGLEIINLALMGCMDAHTVQAFLNVWGYSQEQRPAEILARNVTAVRMDMQLFPRALYLQSVVEGRGYKPRLGQAQDLINKSGLGVSISVQDMDALLIEEDGDEDRAVNKFLSPSKTKTTASGEEEGSPSSDPQMQEALAMSFQQS